MGIRRSRVICLPCLGDPALERGDVAEARDHYAAFLEVGSRIGVRAGACRAWVPSRRLRAARLLGASFSLCESSVGPLSADARAPYEVLRTALRQTLFEATLDAA